MLCPHAVSARCAGDPAAEKDVEDLDKMIKLHPDYIKEEEEKERAWYGTALTYTWHGMKWHGMVRHGMARRLIWYAHSLERKRFGVWYGR